MAKKIMLIADDEEMNRAVISRFMSKEFDVLTAENGVEALNVLRTHPVDVVILDIIMPEMDGISVLKEIRADEKWKNVSVLVATSSKEKTERLALQCGADDIIAKPYDPVILKKRLENIEGRKEMKNAVWDYTMQIDESIKKMREAGAIKETGEAYLERISKSLDGIQNVLN